MQIMGMIARLSGDVKEVSTQPTQCHHPRHQCTLGWNARKVLCGVCLQARACLSAAVGRDGTSAAAYREFAVLEAEQGNDSAAVRRPTAPAVARGTVSPLRATLFEARDLLRRVLIEIEIEGFAEHHLGAQAELFEKVAMLNRAPIKLSRNLSN